MTAMSNDDSWEILDKMVLICQSTVSLGDVIHVVNV